MCGLSLSRQPLPRPLLFQTSVLRANGRNPGAATPRRLSAGQPTAGRLGSALEPERLEPLPPFREERQTISAPALGRVEPLTILDPLEPLPEPVAETPYDLEETLAEELAGPDSFWPVVKMEALEFLILAGLNGFIMLVACLTARAFPALLYGTHWNYLLPVHGAISWAYVMVPLVLVGQSPMMGLERLLIDTDLPERRMSFSLLHLISATLFPISFLCMVLTGNHRTLAELLSGQEILQMPSYRAR